MDLSKQKLKVNEFIKRGEEILVKERHVSNFMPEYISGPLFDTWMGEINIFNERYLKKHPIYKSIHATYFHYKTSDSPCEDMLGHLRALVADDDFFSTILTENTIIVSKVKSIADLLYEDISRCQKYFSDNLDEETGRSMYIDITARYDSIIKDFGKGLYSYFSDQHFYDPNMSYGALNYNLQVLLQKMISYQAVNYGTQVSKREENNKIMSNKVFIVHGHDEAAKQMMARTLEKAGFEAIILHEQANSGSTIIEKIEMYSDVTFAVVLYTECDLGRSKEEKVENEKNRARQNVVFEHGYLIGKLGRKRVCALVKGNVETPGDISGVVYIEMDVNGAWKMSLAKDMQAAGILVDLNKFCN